VRALLIELPAERLSRELDTAWRRLSRSASIPGFRPGKAPRAIVQRHVGAATIEREALQTLLPAAYEDAVAEADIQPIDQPDFDIVEMDRGKPLIFRATVPIRPEVELGPYRCPGALPATGA
jgi:trigger factor